MLTLRYGNLFDSDAQTLVNTVNCVGVMGKGVALEFRKKFPEMYKDYLARCQQGIVCIGMPYLFKSDRHQWIVNFPTKGHWRALTRLTDIEKGLKYLLDHYHEWGIKSMAVPPLGCGLGQLDWSVVQPVLQSYLGKFDIPVELYMPWQVAERRNELEIHDGLGSAVSAKDKSRFKIRPGWVSLVAVLAELEKHPYHWPVGRVFFQKIAYVASLIDIPTELSFVRGSLGPYSERLKSVSTRLQNSGLITEQRIGEMFEVRVGSTFESASKVFAPELSKDAEKINAVADLFMRMNSRQAELVASILFVRNELRERRISELDVMNEVKEWKQNRKPSFEDSEIASTVRTLTLLRWMDIEFSEDLPVLEDL